MITKLKYLKNEFLRDILPASGATVGSILYTSKNTSGTRKQYVIDIDNNTTVLSTISAYPLNHLSSPGASSVFTWNFAPKNDAKLYLFAAQILPTIITVADSALTVTQTQGNDGVTGLIANILANDTISSAPGYQVVNVGGAKNGASATGLTNNTAGYQTVNVGGAKAGGTATGLANDATVYTATIVVDGVSKPITVTGSAAQTYTTLLAEINTDLGASATAALNGGNIRVTSATLGTSSSVAITDGTLFAALTGFVALVTAVAGTITTYTATVVIDGVSKSISVVGGSAQTYTTLLAEINADIDTLGVAAIVGGNLRITSNGHSYPTGGTSTVAITDGTLFAALTNYASIATAVAGGTYTTTTYTTISTVAGGSAAITINSNGTVDLAASTVPGTYTKYYRLTDVNEPTNTKDGLITVTVVPD